MPEGAPTSAFGERSGAPSGLRPSSFVMCNTPVEVQFMTSAGCLNYPCRTPGWPWKERRSNYCCIRRSARPISAAPAASAARLHERKGPIYKVRTDRHRKGSTAMKATLSRLLAATALVMSASSASAQDILLGYLPALEGPFATLSRTNAIAAQIAVDEINTAGGIAGKKVRILSFDTASKTDQAVIGLRKLAEDEKVLAVIG